MSKASRRTFMKAGIAGGTVLTLLPLTPESSFGAATTLSGEIEILGLKARVSLELSEEIPDGSSFEITVQTLTSSRALAHIRYKPGRRLTIKRFSVTFPVPLGDVNQIWYTQQIDGLGQHVYVSLPWGCELPASGHQGSFIAEVQNRFGNNRAFVAFKNQGGDGSIHYAIEYGGKNINVTLNRYVYGGTYIVDGIDETIYIDRDDILWNKAVHRFAEWYDTEWGLTYATPSLCYEPVFNTWYPILAEQSEENIMRFAAKSRELGIKTFEIDYGWFTDTVTWALKTEKIKDMRKTVHELQSMGFKVIIWYNPFDYNGTPGDEGKYQIVHNGKPIGKLCPRCRESRERAARLAKELMERYGLDGLKIDFLDTGGVPLEHCEAGHDHTVDFVGDGVREAMRMMAEAIRSVKPDALIEYRLNYANVANRAFANCYRGQDAPADPDHIRRHLALLRSWCRGVAPHADYAYWTADVSEENVARTMAIITLFGVPTLSVDFDALPENHFAIAREWLSFYQRYKRQLVNSVFDPLSNDVHYSVARFSGADHTFIPVFLGEWPASLPVLPHCASTIILFNGTAQRRVLTRITGLREKYRITTKDIMLRTVGEPVVATAHNGAIDLEHQVTIGGLIFLDRI